MIELRLELKCDGCGRQQVVSCEGAQGTVSVPGLLASIGWGMFLAGPTLCQECVQDELVLKRVERVSRIVGETVARTLSEPVAVFTPKPAVVPAATFLPVPALPFPPSYRYRRYSDAEILAAIAAANGNKAAAAKALGMSCGGFYERVKRLGNGVGKV